MARKPYSPRFESSHSLIAPIKSMDLVMFMGILLSIFKKVNVSFSVRIGFVMFNSPTGHGYSTILQQPHSTSDNNYPATD